MEQGGLSPQAPNRGRAMTGGAPASPARRTSRPVDPYKEQISELKLTLKQLKLNLKQITTNMSSTRAQYHETSAFVPEGLLHKGYKWFEDIRLLGPQQQKQQLQNRIMQLEQELINLQQQQAYWKSQQ